jgi:hypothetical protein
MKLVTFHRSIKVQERIIGLSDYMTSVSAGIVVVGIATRYGLDGPGVESR